MEQGLTIRLLGPVSVCADGVAHPVGSRPQRIVLALLALEAGRVVSSEALIDALWPEGAPANAAGNLHSYVSKLRRLVAPVEIAGEHGGYRLEIDGSAVDAVRIAKVADDPAAVGALDARSAAAVLDEALSLWHGEPLADLHDNQALMPARVRLESVRGELSRRRLSALVDAGDHTAALPGLREAAARDPIDESVVALLARALHATGRSAEALRTINAFRRRIGEETGVEAGSGMDRLEQSILHDDPDLSGRRDRPGGGREGSAAAAVTSRWPRSATPLHGRREELERLAELTGAQRLVSVVGTGGIGKSRVACALADRRSAEGQEVHFLALASLAPDDDLAARAAAALGISVHDGQDASTEVHRRIGSGGQLLVLDNCEHVLGSVRRFVESLLSQRSDLSVLATSRSPLGLSEEHVVRLTHLGEPTDAGRELFLERVRRVRPGYEPGPGDQDAVSAVVRGSGGLPLAIELAAGRMASMSLAELAARIDDLDLLADGRSTHRHSTLRSAIDWSYRLLPDAAARLLRTMSVFPAGVDLATVEGLSGQVGLSGRGTGEVVTLAEASLVDVDLDPDRGGSSRYTMLEPVRRFAFERLEAEGELSTAISLRAEWARRTVAWIEEASRSPEEAVADARLRSELVNLRAVHRAALQLDDLDTAIAIDAALVRPGTARNLPEIWSWALDLAGHPRLREHQRWADALGAAATASWLTGALAHAEALATEGLRQDPDSVPCLQALASVRLLMGQPEAAHRAWVQASRPDGAYLPQAALAAVYSGDGELAARSLAEADDWAEGTGSPSEVALCRYARGELLGPDPAALREYEEAIALASAVGATFVASISRVGLASTLAVNGQHLRAAEEFDEVVRYWRSTGNWTQQWTTLRNLAGLFESLDRGSTARRIRAEAASSPAATPEPGSGSRDPGDRGPGSSRTDDELVVLVLAELADLRRDLAVVQGRT